MPNLSLRQKLREYGFFTPQSIFEAVEASRQLPIPADSRTLKLLGYQNRNGTARQVIDLPLGVAWRGVKLARARGISRGQLWREIITYYIMAVDQKAFDNVPGVYQDLLSDAGIVALARALRLAQAKIDEEDALQERVDAPPVAREEPIVLTPQNPGRSMTPPPTPPTPEEKAEHDEW